LGKRQFRIGVAVAGVAAIIFLHKVLCAEANIVRPTRGFVSIYVKLHFFKIIFKLTLDIFQKTLYIVRAFKLAGFTEINQPLNFRGFAAILLIKAAHQNV
jgi:hypothetical protein